MFGHLGYLSILSAGLLAALPLLVVLHHAPPMTDDPRPQKEHAVNLFAKAEANLNLAPWERAILKLVQALFAAFLVAAAPVLADALSSHAVIDWSTTLHNGLLLGSMAALMTLIKYLRAQKDQPLAQFAADELQNLATTLSDANGLNEPVTEPDPPPTDTPAAAALAA